MKPIDSAGPFTRYVSYKLLRKRKKT